MDLDAIEWSPVPTCGYIICFFASYLFYKLKKAEQKRIENGKIIKANIIKMCSNRISNDCMYYLSYKFIHNGLEYTSNYILPFRKWKSFKGEGTEIEIIIDPQDAEQYNFPFYSQDLFFNIMIIKWVIFGIIWISMFGIWFGVILELSWFGILISSFIIPILVSLLFYCLFSWCWKRYGPHYDENSHFAKYGHYDHYKKIEEEAAVTQEEEKGFKAPLLVHIENTNIS